MSLLQMSAAGAVMILAVIVIRALAVNHLPKNTFRVLWAVVLVRLLVPFSLPSGFSIYALLARSTDPAAVAKAAAAARPAITASPAMTETLPQAAPAAAAMPSVWSMVWAAGLVICAAVFAVTYWKCYQEFQMSLPVEHDAARQWLQAHPLRRTVAIRQSDRISSPLTFGILHPVILMPKNTDWADEAALQYVLEHEFVHICRFDTAAKLLLIAAVCVHWFNPLVWAMYVLANRDIELSCDETVVRHFGTSARAAYARVLIRMEETRSGFAPLCSHFSSNAMEERIIAIMKLKKTTITSLLVAAALVAGTTTVFATSAPAKTNPSASSETTAVESGAADSTTEEETIMSYVNADDGQTYYSFDDGKTFTPLTDAEYEALYPTQDIEWWTYDEYKAWLENEKVQLQSMLGERGSVNGGEEFVWTQEKIDETIALYEETLQDIKNGMMYSKTVDGQDDVLVVYNPADQAMGTSSDE